MNGQVHLAEFDGFGYPFLPIDGNLGTGVFLVRLHKGPGLDEHTAGPAGRVIDLPGKWLNHLYDEFYNSRWSEKLPPFSLSHDLVVRTAYENGVRHK